MSRNTWAAADVPYHVSDPRELALISGAEFWAVDCYAPTGEVVEHCQCYDYFSECATASLFLSSAVSPALLCLCFLCLSFADGR